MTTVPHSDRLRLYGAEVSGIRARCQRGHSSKCLNYDQKIQRSELLRLNTINSNLVVNKLSASAVFRQCCDRKRCKQTFKKERLYWECHVLPRRKNPHLIRQKVRSHLCHWFKLGHKWFRLRFLAPNDLKQQTPSFGSWQGNKRKVRKKTIISNILYFKLRH